MKYSRALWLWGSFVPLMIVNGALREVILKPALGELAAHVLSTIIGVTLLFAITLGAIDWIGPKGARDAWRIGVSWLFLTIAFEFLAGHFLFGSSWRSLLADYNVLRGRVWLLILCGQLLSPRLALHIRQKSVSGRQRRWRKFHSAA